MAQREGNPKEELRLEAQVAYLERELAEQYCQLGRRVYEAVENNVAGINRLVDRLVESKRGLNRVRSQIPCAGCLALNPEDNDYCGRCGRRLESEE